MTFEASATSAPAITVGPFVPEPTAITARAPCLTLRDHFLAFLSANNPGGFPPEVVDEVPASSIGDLMLLVAQYDYLKVYDFKGEAKKLRKASKGHLCHSQCLDLLSRLFGYAGWNEASSTTQDGLIANRRNRANINLKVFHGDMK